MRVIAHIENDYKEKFGVPRQAGLAAVESRIVMESGYRIPEAFRGLAEYDYIWLLWDFSEGFASVQNQTPITHSLSWSPTVRPPRLGGNVRMGVFATRSPNRPNPIGLSSVKLLRVEEDPELGPVLYVEGADLMDGTPIYDIKPYIPYTDSHPEARGGFADRHANDRISVIFSEGTLEMIPEEKRRSLTEVLSQDPRPSYQEDPERIYGMDFASRNIRFTVNGRVLTVISISPEEK